MQMDGKSKIIRTPRGDLRIADVFEKMTAAEEQGYSYDFTNDDHNHLYQTYRLIPC